MVKRKKDDINKKKPFYKKIWFWVVVVLLLWAYGSLNPSKDNSTNADKSATKQETIEPKTKSKPKAKKETLPLQLTSDTYKKAISNNSGNVKFEAVTISSDDNGKNIAVVNFKLKSAITEKMAVRGILSEMSDILKTTKQKFDYNQLSNIEIFAKLPMIDSGGNTKDEIVATAKINGQKLNDLNVKNFDSTKIPVFVDEYWQNESLPTIN
jgi:hypothetical protein